MKRLIALTLAAFLLLGLAMAYTGEMAITEVAADANSSNFNLSVHSAMVATNGNTTNYTVAVDAYAFDVQDDIYVAPPPDDDDDDDGGSSRTTSSNPTFFPSTIPAVDEPVEVTISFSSLVSTENESLVIESPRENDMFEQLNVSMHTEMRNVQFRVVETTGASQRAELSLFSGEVYKLLDVLHDVIPEDDIIEITLSFKVEKSWVDDRNLNLENVTLFRYDGFEWEPLMTNHSRTDANYYYFISLSPGLSTYVVGVEEEPEPEVAAVVETVPIITGNAAVDTTDNTSSSDDIWDDYAAPKKLTWLWMLFIVILVGGGVGAFIMFKKKQEPVQEKPAGTPTATTIPEKKEVVKQESSFAQEPPKEEPSVADEPETGFVEEAPDEESMKDEQPIEKPIFTDEDEHILTNFIQSLLDKGFSIQQFKSKLIVKGWSEKQIDHCLQKLGKR